MLNERMNECVFVTGFFSSTCAPWFWTRILGQMHLVISHVRTDVSEAAKSVRLGGSKTG